MKEYIHQLKLLLLTHRIFEKTRKVNFHALLGSRFGLVWHFMLLFVMLHMSVIGWSQDIVQTQGLNYQLSSVMDNGDVVSGNTSNFDSSIASSNQTIEFKGYIDLAADDVYTFYVNTGGTYTLSIGGQEVLSKTEFSSTIEKSIALGVNKGRHSITLVYVGNTDQSLTLSYEATGLDKQLIPDQVLYRDEAVDNSNRIVSGDITSGVFKISVEDTITASNAISGDDTKVYYQAGGPIFLMDGFKTLDDSYFLAQDQVSFLASYEASDAYIDLSWAIQANNMSLPDNGELYVQIWDVDNQVEVYSEEHFVLNVFEGGELNSNYRHDVGDDKTVSYELNVFLKGEGTKVINTLEQSGKTSPYLPPTMTTSQGTFTDQIRVGLENRSDLISVYNVFRDDEQITTLDVSETLFQDIYSGLAGIANGAEYTYCIEAYGDRFGKTYDQQICLPASTYALSPEASDATSESEILVSWQDASAFADQVWVLRDNELLIQLPGDAISFLDEDPILGKMHSYSVALVQDGKTIVAAADEGHVRANGAISGRVTSGENHFAVHKALVIAKTEVEGITYADTVKTDETGAYQFHELYYGRESSFTVSVSKEGHDFTVSEQQVELSRDENKHEGIDFNEDRLWESTTELFVLENFSVTSEPDRDHVAFSWDYTLDTDSLWFNIYRKETQSADSTLLAVFSVIEDGNTTYEDISGKPNEAYVYTLQAYANDEANQVYRELRSATIDFPVVKVPHNFTAINDANGSMQLQWEHTSPNVSGFTIYRDDQKIDSLAANKLSYTDLTGTPGTEHLYSITAYRVLPDFTYHSDTVEASQLVSYPSLPQVTNLVAVAERDEERMKLTWTYPVADTYNYDGVIITRDSEEIVRISKNFSASYFDEAGIPDQTHSYGVSTFKSNGETTNLSTALSTTVTFPEVKALQTFTASADQIGYVSLTWEHDSKQIDGFVIKRTTGEEVATLPIGSRSYDDILDSNTGTAGYSIKAYTQRKGVTYYSAELTAQGSSDADGGSSFPEAVTSFTASENLASHVLLEWTYPDYILANFEILRDGAVISEEALDTDYRVFYDDSATPGVMHTYQIRAVYDTEMSHLVGTHGKLQELNTLKGVVKSMDGGFTIPGVTITATATLDEESGHTFFEMTETDAAGFYKITDIPSQEGLTLTVEASLQNHIFEEDAQTVEITSDQFSYEVNFLDESSGEGEEGEEGEEGVIAQPIDVMATANDISQDVTIRWNVTSKNYSGFRVFRALNKITEIPNRDLRAFTDTEGAPGYEYPYLVQTYWRYKNDTLFSEPVEVQTTYPKIPAVEELKVVSMNGQDLVKLTWSHPTDQHDYYEISRQGVVLDTLHTRNIFSYKDTLGIPGQNYMYSVTAVKAMETGVFRSDPMSEVGMFPLVTPVTDISAVPEINSVSLSWNMSSELIDGYYIQRNGNRIDVLSKDATSYKDAEGTPGINHEYRVVSFLNKNGQNLQSIPVKVSVDYPALTPITALDYSADDGFITLRWDYASSDISGFEIRRDGTLLDKIYNTEGRNYEDRGGTPRSTHKYSVTVFDVRSEELYESIEVEQDVDFPALPAPTEVTATDAEYWDYVKIRWEYGQASIDSLDIYRDDVMIATVGGGKRSYNDVIDSRSYTDPTITTYSYKVKARRNRPDESDYSESAFSNSETGHPEFNTIDSEDTGPITNVQATDLEFINKVRVTWDEQASDEEVKVYREDVLVGSANISKGYLDDNEGIPGKNYVYRVLVGDVSVPTSSGADLGSRQANGKIKGQVLTEQDRTGVAGIAITAKTIVDKDIYSYEAVTNSEGTFELAQLYYDERAEYTVSAHEPGHHFTENDLPVSLSLDETTGYANFVDETAYVIKGIARRTGASCGIDSVKVELVTTRSSGDPITQEVYTDVNGFYSFTINPLDSDVDGYNINIDRSKEYTSADNRRVSTTFDWQPDDYDITDPTLLDRVTTMDFVDDSTYTVGLSVRSVCGSIGDNRFSIQVNEKDGCFSQIYETLDNGQLNIELPPLDYEVVVVGVNEPTPATLAVVDYLRVRPANLDLLSIRRDLEAQQQVDEDDLKRLQEVSIQLTYHKAPQFTITGLEPSTCSIVLEQGETRTLGLIVSEQHDEELCKVSDGFLIIKNEAKSTVSDQIDTLHYDPATGKFQVLDQGTYSDYSFTVGEPNIVSPYLLSIIVEYHTEEGGFQGERIERVLVTGSKAAPGMDVIVTPDSDEDAMIQLPLFILRDPPGDGSYSYIEKGASFSKTLSVSDFNSGGAALKTDQKFQAANKGFKVQASFKAGGGEGESHGLDISITTTEQLATSPEMEFGDQYLFGDEADVIVGAGMASGYGIAQSIEINDYCEIEKSYQISNGLTGIPTTWIYTVDFIRERVDEYSRNLNLLEEGLYEVEDEDTQDTRTDLETLRDNWKAILDYHSIETLPYCEVCNLDNYNEEFREAIQQADVYSDFCSTSGALKEVTVEGVKIVVCNENFLWDANAIENYQNLNVFRNELDDFIEYTRWDNANPRGNGSEMLDITRLLVNNAEYDAYDEYLKLYGPEVENITFSGGTSYEKSVSLSRSRSTGYTQKTYVNIETFVGSVLGTESQAGGGLGAIFLNKVLTAEKETGIASEYNFEFEKNKENSEESTAAVGYVLADGDAGDQYSVTVVKGVDPTQTPYFDLVGGRSSCPAIPGTIPLDLPQITLEDEEGNLYNSEVWDVDPEEGAVFSLKLANTSPFESKRLFDVFMPSGSNRRSAPVLFNRIEEAAISLHLATGEPEYAHLTIGKGPEHYDFEDIQIVLRPACESFGSVVAEVADTLHLKVHFKRPCSPISLLSDGNVTTDGNHWVINKATSPEEREQLFLKLVDYDPESEPLEDVSVEYRRLGSNDWNIIETLEKEELLNYYEEHILTYPNPTYPYVWDITEMDLPDGEYEIRASTACGTSGENYSNILTGTIARTGIQIFGIPEPADKVLSLGDEISVSFNQLIDCDVFDPEQFSLVLVEDERVAIDYQISCYDNTLKVVMNDEERNRLEGKVLKAQIDEVKDLFGNALQLPVSWEFRVHQNPVYWHPDTLSIHVVKGEAIDLKANLHNSLDAEYSYELSFSEEVSWITATQMTGVVPASGTNVSLKIQTESTVLGTHEVNLVASINGFNDEALHIKLHVSEEPPKWQVDAGLFEENMTVVANFKINNGARSTDTLDLISVWIDGQIRGVANIQKVTESDYVAYLNVGGNAGDAGRELSFRVWDASAGEEYDGHMSQQLSYAVDAYEGTTAHPRIIHVNDEADRAEYIPLRAGWNWISTNRAMTDMSVKNFLASLKPTDGDRIKTASQLSTFDSGSGWVSLDGLDNMSTDRGYKLYLSNADTLRLTGSNALSNTVQLNNGWNLIGYPLTESEQISQAMGLSDTEAEYLLKDQSSQAHYADQEWSGSLNTLEPFSAYELNVSSSYQVVLNYTASTPSNGRAEAITLSSRKESEIDGWSVAPSDYRYNMTITGDLLMEEEHLSSGAWVAAFVGEECRGIGQLVSTAEGNRLSLFVYSNQEGEEISFKVFDPINSNTGMVDNTIIFSTNQHYGSITEPVAFESKVALSDGDSFIYPNPFDDVTTLVYQVPSRDSKVTIELFNLEGRKVKELVRSENHESGIHRLAFKREGLPAGLYFCHLSIDDHVEVKKVLIED